ncbi:probable RNA-binding protein 18 [Coccinella septempunctata]|uniref:probable RNA-binding protein 18 n=1 Tax=Coccinella septempunctata TaxID=41139 RepID=UPI001D091751|nr:probable RNA-binding protein 18 [Coccinella septempunctata]
MSTEVEESNKKIKDWRLWIGNLDFRITEYQLLKLVQKHGDIAKFDLLFHRTGPQAGQPRGYAFVTYMKEEDALKAKDKLHNMLVGQKKIIVAWAHSINDEEITKPRQEIVIPALAMAKPVIKNDRESQIQAIEAKLKLLEEKSTSELKINDTVATKPPVIAQYQYNKIQSKLKTKVFDLKKSNPYKKSHNNRR